MTKIFQNHKKRIAKKEVEHTRCAFDLKELRVNFACFLVWVLAIKAHDMVA